MLRPGSDLADNNNHHHHHHHNNDDDGNDYYDHPPRPQNWSTILCWRKKPSQITRVALTCLIPALKDNEARALGINRIIRVRPQPPSHETSESYVYGLKRLIPNLESFLAATERDRMVTQKTHQNISKRIKTRWLGCHPLCFLPGGILQSSTREVEAWQADTGHQWNTWGMWVFGLAPKHQDHHIHLEYLKLSPRLLPFGYLT